MLAGYGLHWMRTAALGCLALCLLAAPAIAGGPALQIGIDGGFYDTTTQTILTDEDVFTVYAYAIPKEQLTLDEIQNDKFYLAIALTPQTSGSADLGSFTVDGSTVDVTDDMVYGTPPIETGNVTQLFDPNDLSKHGIYDTYFVEVKFMFDDNMQTTIFNTQDDPDNSLFDPNGTGMYYVSFEIDKSLLDPNVELHFDLYNVELKSYTKHGVNYFDVDRARFAPFSHDGGTGPPVPEPSAALVFAIGALVVGARVKRRR
jgi:hypothetical protein